MDEYFNIGKLAATHGLKGQLILTHALGNGVRFEKLKWIFLQQSGNSFLPYVVLGCDKKNDTECFIQLEGITSKESARTVLKKEVWITQEDFRKLSSAQTPISWLGCTIVDGKNEVGVISEIIEQPHQILCTVLLGDKEAYIPVHENNLQKVDLKNKKIFVQIPEGLLDIYKEG